MSRYGKYDAGYLREITDKHQQAAQKAYLEALAKYYSPASKKELPAPFIEAEFTILEE